MKVMKLLLTINIIFIIIISIIVFVQGNTPEEKIIYKTETIYQNITQECPTIEPIPDWLKIVKTFHEGKEYKKGEYDCRMYSRDLEIELSRLGYNAKKVCGKDIREEDTPGHCWVRITIDYEPQTGQEMSPFYKTWDEINGIDA